LACAPRGPRLQPAGARSCVTGVARLTKNEHGHPPVITEGTIDSDP